MRKPLAFKITVDPKNLQRAIVILTGEIMTPEEIDAKFFDREDILVDDKDLQTADLELTLGFAAVMLAKDAEAEEKPARKSKFQKKLEEEIQKKMDEETEKDRLREE